MPMQFVLAGTDLGDDKVRLGEMTGLVESGDGTVGMGGIELDDPPGSLVVDPLLDFHVDETDATPTRTFTGYVADRKISHAASMLSGSARRWSVTLVDLNAIAEFRIFASDDATRPAETDIARITWLLGTERFDLVVDHGLIDSTGPVSMDAADYKGRRPREVLDDCMAASGKVWFLTYDDATGDPTLAYFDPVTSSLFTSSARLTDDRGDIDESTTFYVRNHPELTKDPSQLYQGAYVHYANGWVYVQNIIPGIPYRDMLIEAPQCGTAASATALGNSALAKAATESDTINCVVKMPKAHVNDIRAGQRVQVKFAELPGYDTYRYVRVVRRTISQVQTTEDFYDVPLELRNTKTIVPSGGGTAPDEGGGDVEPSPAELCLDAAPEVGFNVEPHYDGPAERGCWQIYNTFGWGFKAFTIGSTNGCGIGSVRYEGGCVTSWAQKLGAISAIPANAVALRLTMTIVRRTATAGGIVVYLKQTTPQSWDDGAFVWSGDAVRTPGTTVVVDIPTNLLTTGLLWLTFSGVKPIVGIMCGSPGLSGDLENQPLDAYSYMLPTPSCEWVSVCPDSVGIIDWAPGHGAVDGLNRTYTIDGWDGTGLVQASVNGLSAPVASTDAVASTVTLATAPPPYSIVLFRYSTGAA